MKDLIEITEEDWFDTFNPIPNHIDENASFNDGEHGYMFETYGEELEFVKAQEPNRIWTYGEGDNGTYIWNGWHVVNRLGYFITTLPFDDKQDYQITISSEDIYICDNCNEVWEDETAALCYEKFVDLDKCPACATMDELKEIEERDE